MAKSTLTREWLQHQISAIEAVGITDSNTLAAFKLALAAMGSEPVFFIEVEGDDWINAGRIPGSSFDFNNLPDGINYLYAAPQPLTDAERDEQEGK